MFWTQVKKKVKLAPYTTFKIGGPADYFFVAKKEKELIGIINEAKEKHIKYFILGNGSNILIADTGFKGLVIKNEITGISFNNQQVQVAAGEKVSSLLSAAKEEGFSGLEFLAGIPATIGGVVWANAGSLEKNISQLVEKVIILKNGVVTELTNQECQFNYRNSIFKRNKNYIILSIILNLKKSDKKIIEKEMKTIINKKIKTQDLNNPSVGSIFKNPPGEKKAWELIKDVELVGFKIGGAQVSLKHANFIINTGQATASDVIMLVSLIKQKVRDNLGVQLMEEVEYIGF